MLTIRNLTHTYPNGVRALNQIDLDMPKGMFGLLGPNGAGKSSLMRTLATLQQPTSGDITLEGINVLEEPGAVRRVLGYLPQDFGVYPRGSAYSLLDHIAILKGVTDAKVRKDLVDSLLEKTNLYDARKRRLSTFSGGMRQRFGIAQAVIGRPKLIIVDEPTAGLDPQERNRFHNLLSEIGEDIVVVLSTHIVSDVADLCSNMAIMAQGQIVCTGTPDELIERAQGKLWQKVINKSEFTDYKTRHNVISTHLSSGKFVIRVEANTCPEQGFEPSDANLEDVYFSAIQSHVDEEISS